MIDWISARPTELKNPHTLLKKPHSIVYVLAYDLKSNWTTRSLRTADAFPVVAFLPPGEKQRPEMRLRFAG